jgi:ABC-type microcin C transport system duplicated ATPase subunit YejF
MIEMTDLHKDFTVRVRAGRFRRQNRTVRAVDGVTLRIEPGEMVGYIGRCPSAPGSRCASAWSSASARSSGGICRSASRSGCGGTSIGCRPPTKS